MLRVRSLGWFAVAGVAYAAVAELLAKDVRSTLALAGDENRLSTLGLLVTFFGVCAALGLYRGEPRLDVNEEGLADAQRRRWVRSTLSATTLPAVAVATVLGWSLPPRALGAEITGLVGSLLFATAALFSQRIFLSRKLAASVLVLLLAAAHLIALLARTPAFTFSGWAIVVSERASLLPIAAALLVAVSVAIDASAARLRWARTPKDADDATVALLFATPATLLAAASGALALTAPLGASGWPDTPMVTVTLASLSMLASALALRRVEVDFIRMPRVMRERLRRVAKFFGFDAAPSGVVLLRRVLGGAFVFCLSAVASWLVVPNMHRALWTGTAVLAGGAVAPFFIGLVDHVFAPFGGRVANAFATFEHRLWIAQDFDTVVEHVLLTLREASGDHSTEPVLFTRFPELELRLGKSGGVVRREKAMPGPFAVLAESDEVLLATTIEARLVRHPEERPLADALHGFAAAAIIPVRAEGTFEAVLVLPRGERSAPFELEEVSAMKRGAHALGGPLARMLDVLRATQRAEGAEERERRALDANHELDRTASLVREENWALKRAYASELAPLPFAYSPARKQMIKRANELGPLHVPVLLTAEPGTRIHDVARLVHRMSGRARGPCIVMDCASLQVDTIREMLFGVEKDSEVRLGAIRVAAGGSLVLLDVVALPLDVRAELAMVMTERRATPTGGGSSYAVDARFMFGARTGAPLGEPLTEELTNTILPVPSLAACAEDFPSAVYAAIDRVARCAGRESMGIDPAALEELVRYDWPHNEAELDLVLERALHTSSGTRLSLADVRAALPTKPKASAVRRKSRAPKDVS